MSKKEIAVIGGDERALYAAKRLCREGYACRLYALGEGKNPCCEGFEKGSCQAPYLLRATLEGALCALLPIPLTRDGKTLNAPRLSAPLPLGQLLSQIPKDLPLVCGGGVQYFEGHGAPVADLLEDEEFTKKNALPTAEGALALAVMHHPSVLKGSSCGVLGYGAIGGELARLLKNAGAQVHVFARRPESRAQARQNGVDAYPFEALAGALPAFDLIFNTVPAPVMPEERLDALQSDALYIELASKPFGMAEGARGRLSCKHLFAQGLPGKYAPAYAGALIGEKILSLIKQEGVGTAFIKT